MIGAVDIGGTKIAVGIVSEQGVLLADDSWATNPQSGAETGVQRIISGLKNILSQVNLPLEGIGVACTGPVNPLTGMLGDVEFLPSWAGLNLCERLSDAFHVGCAMENDADAAALGEYTWGCGRGSSRFIYLTVSTGIGAGVILDGKLYRGKGGAHPEIGHHVIDVNGPICFCGGRGCWESTASGPAFAQWYNQESAFASCTAIDARQICERARKGEPLALQAIEREGKFLGIGIANLITIFAPEIIALGGGVMLSFDLFEPYIRKMIAAQDEYFPADFTRLIPVQNRASASLIGAACAWIHHQK
ncbi:MAG TPA: ROK family protein [Anaerolineaceae bacterium]